MAGRSLRGIAEAQANKLGKKSSRPKSSQRTVARGHSENVEIVLANTEANLEFADMNKTEARFSKWLDTLLRIGEIQCWDFEPMSLRIGKGAWYKGDFLVVTRERELVMYEVKGHWEEAARVRIKVAATRFPWMKFVAVKAGAVNETNKPAWTYEEIAPWVSTSMIRTSEK